jgi:hypothetical protein
MRSIRWTSTGLLALALISLPACNCGGESGTKDGGGKTDSGITDGGAKDGGTKDGGSDGGAVACIPPDVLIALDRTLTMHRLADGNTPPDTDAGHAASKWSMAINGIEQLTAAPLDQGIRFGLELWPKQSAGCITLASRIQGNGATNPNCEDPEIVVPPALNTGATISALLDPETTLICTSTPTGAALIGARTYLEANRLAGRQQFVALVTDGADWDFSCPNPSPLGVVDQLTDAGISTLIVGFSAESSLMNGVGGAFLNDMACAGGTAKGFPAPCVKNDAGVYRAKDPDAGVGNSLFYAATNTVELVGALRTFAKTVCCDCIN